MANTNAAEAWAAADRADAEWVAADRALTRAESYRDAVRTAFESVAEAYQVAWDGGTPPRAGSGVPPHHLHLHSGDAELRRNDPHLERAEAALHEALREAKEMVWARIDRVAAEASAGTVIVTRTRTGKIVANEWPGAEPPWEDIRAALRR